MSVHAVHAAAERNVCYIVVLLDFSLTVKAAPHECVIRTIVNLSHR